MKHYIYLTIATLALIFTACKDDSNPETDKMYLTVNGMDYTILLNGDTTIDLTTMSIEFDADITVNNAYQFQKLSIDGNNFVGGNCQYKVDTIDYTKQIHLSYRSGDREGTIHLNTLHSGVPQFDISGRASDSGEFYLSFVYLRLIMKYDHKGNLLYYRFEPHQPQFATDNTGWWDFKKHSIHGQTYYSYHAPDPNFADRVMSGYNPGMRVIMDRHYNIVKTIQLLSSGPYVSNGDPIDGHDFYMYDLDHYIVSSYIDRQLDDRTVASAYLQEVENGKVIFDWWSVDHNELDDMLDPVFATSVDKDYVHFNSLQVLPNENWFCSFRNISTVMEIDRKNGTGAIVRRTTGYEQTGDNQFHGQHYARINNLVLTVFNNNNGSNPPASHPSQFYINPSTGEASGYTNLIAEEQPYFTQACGSVTTLSNGNIVVGWGMPGSSEVESSNRLVSEYSGSQEIFSIRNTAATAAENKSRCSYRCVKMN